MAQRSPRRQADVAAVLHSAGLVAEPQLVTAALCLLRREGCVTNLVPLADGGLLLTVTGRGSGATHTEGPWLPLDEADASE
jgi:hypothetical protein